MKSGNVQTLVNSGLPLSVIEFPGWRLRNANQTGGLHWAIARKMQQPPVGMVWNLQTSRSLVSAPHPRRLVVVTRWGRGTMDEDNLVASVKPVLDRIKAKRIVMGKCEGISPGLIWDDAPQYCKLIVLQGKAPYRVDVSVYAMPEQP